MNPRQVLVGALFAGASLCAHGQPDQQATGVAPVVVIVTNTVPDKLVTFSVEGQLLAQQATGGNGGVKENAGSIAQGYGR